MDTKNINNTVFQYILFDFFQVYIMAWYYIYTMKKFYRQNNLLQKFDAKLFNSDKILSNAIDLKLDTRKRYMLHQAENIVNLEKRKELMNNANINDVENENSIKLDDLKSNAISLHISGLQEIKDLFEKLKQSTNIKDVITYSFHVNNIYKFQNAANKQYKSIVIEFPNNKETTRLYAYFLTDVMTIQEQLKTGEYGGPTFDAYPSEYLNVLKTFLIKVMFFPNVNNHYRIITNNNHTTEIMIGFSKELGTLPINELIREYLYYVNNFIYDVENKKYIRLPFYEKEDIQTMFDQEINDSFFKLQEGLMNNIYGAIQFINAKLNDYTEEYLQKNNKTTIEIIIIGIVLLIFIDILIFNNFYNEKIHEMDSLITFMFLTPQQIVNRHEKFKK
ncbi:hypothetical protein PIROE2DRAFT_58857 [Piromyces sp. E2]|nr:hypothetical protein PIROE2DRAFT_58857 [Piromyces sp. E2]|eukprot:OUM67312.1 hypothetical protein PIROE2DRAFT_58857 [Piromyces sp. E2]